MGKVPTLHSRRDFLRVQSQGKRWRGAALTVLVARGEEAPRVGLTVSRKVGNAVMRNRIRRRLREIVRLHQDLLCRGRDYVVVAYPLVARTPFRALTEELTCLLKRVRDGASARPS